MRVLCLIAAALMVAGCSATSVPRETEAVRDYVAVTDLDQVMSIRLYKPLRYGYVNDYFVVVEVGDRYYLVEFEARCYSLRAKTYTQAMVDQRYDPNYIHRKDTIRGCPIEHIYKASAEEVIEIKQLSKAIAEGAVLPEDV